MDSELDDKNSALKDSKHSLNAVFSWYLYEWNFDLLELLPNILTVPPFQIIYFLSLHCDFVVHAGLETW